MAEGRIAPYSLNELKNTTDDALGNYLRGLQFKQDNSKLDVRLAVGYVSVIIAAATFVADYKLGWEATKHWTAIAVVAYAILNGVFTYWMWAVEKGLVFEGTKDGKRLIIASKTKKYDPTYHLTVTSSSSTASSLSATERQLKAPFSQWFTSDGYFVAQPFQQWLASSVDLIGAADSKNVSNGQDVIAAAANGSPVATSGSDMTGSVSKRSKKKG